MMGLRDGEGEEPVPEGLEREHESAYFEEGYRFWVRWLPAITLCVFCGEQFSSGFWLLAGVTAATLALKWAPDDWAQPESVVKVSLEVIMCCVNTILRTRANIQEGSDINAYRMFALPWMMTIFYHTFVIYTPGRAFFMACCPCWFLCWLAYHSASGIGLAGVDVTVGLGVLLLASLCRSANFKVHRDNYVATHKLREAHKSMEDILSAQQSMLATFFDASGVCNALGEVTNATPQLQQLLDPESKSSSLTLPSLVAPGERDRLRTFFRTSWDTSVMKPTMIHSTLGGVPGQERTLEVKLHCIKLPSRTSSAAGTGLWAGMGLFLGVQEVPQALQSQEGPQVQLGGGARSKEVVVMSIDAGSPSLQVLGGDEEPIGDARSGLLDYVLSPAREEVDSWVYVEVQGALADRYKRSERSLRAFRLKLPSLGLVLEAEKAWLDIPPLNQAYERIPVLLCFRGLRAVARGSAVPRLPRLDEEAGEEHESSLGDSQSDVSTVLVEDSISQC